MTKLPIFPRTPHLPGASAVGRDDITADKAQWEADLARATTIFVTEKLDGANARVCWDGGEGVPVIGNRDKTLKKAYIKKDTPAKLQFRPLWNWVYEHRAHFRTLHELVGSPGEPPVVFGEWLYATHTIGYDNLPSLFMAFDIWVDGKFMDPEVAYWQFFRSGFRTPATLADWLAFPKGTTKRAFPSNDEDIFVLPEVCGPSAYVDGLREGIYIKLGDGVQCFARYKAVRPGFKPREDFNTSPLVRNIVGER